MYILKEVHGARYANEEKTAVNFDVTLVDDQDEEDQFRALYTYSASDPATVQVQLTEWISENPDFPIEPYVKAEEE